MAGLLPANPRDVAAKLAEGLLSARRAALARSQGPTLLAHEGAALKRREGARQLCTAQTGKSRGAPDSADETRPMNEHYAAVRDSYHRAWFYAKDSPYEKWQLKLVTEAFNLNSSTARLADIGGGTGRFAGLLHAHLGLENDVTCVDMSDEMLKEAETLSGVTTRCADAASFAASLESASYDGFLLKEIVHHLGPEDCLGMYQHLVRGLRAGGMCVTVTRPKFEIDYPLFEAARTVWQNNQEDVAVYADMMRKAGFQDVRFKIERFPVTMFLSDWTHMVGNRMWSTFSEAHFSEAELQRGIQELREACATDAEGRITFDEKLVVLVGSS